MTTDDLIEILKAHPGKQVLVDGYEAGYDIPHARLQRVAPSSYWKGKSMEGQFEDENLGDASETDKFDALILSRDP